MQYYNNNIYTSTKVGVRFIWSEVEGLSWPQSDVVEKEHTETANISRKLVIESQ